MAGTATDFSALQQAMRGIDTVVHATLAPVGEDAFAYATRTFDVDVTSVHLTLLQAAHQSGLRQAVHLSSLSVYQDFTDRHLDESAPADATCLYGLTK